MAVVLAVMSFVVFMLIGLMPGDPIDIMIASNPDLTPADGERLKRLHGLDLPLWERYANWLGGVFTGDLGFSRTYNRPVLEILLPRLGNTVILLGLSSIVAILVAIPLGVIAATRPQSKLDGAINLFCFAGIYVVSKQGNKKKKIAVIYESAVENMTPAEKNVLIQDTY